MFLPHFFSNGALVAQIETVMVARAERSKGIGETMMRWAIDRAPERKCSRVQLTSNKRSHAGMKLWL